MKKSFLLSFMLVFLLSATVVYAANLTQFRPHNVTATTISSRPVNWIETDSGFSSGIGVGQISVGMNDETALWAHAIDATGAIIDQFTRSTDGGQTWTAGTFNAGDGLSQLFAIDATTCWAIFNTGATQGCYKTTDGGATWVNMNAGYGANSFANVIHFFNDNDGFAQGDPLGGYYELYTTTDGGNTWVRVPQADIPAPTTGEYGITGNYDAVGDNIWWGTNQGRIFYSTDKGYTWDATLTPFGATTVVNATFADENYGIAYRSYLDMGIEPAINVTTNGGVTWTNVNVVGSMYARYFSYIPGTTNTYIGSSSELGFEGASYSEDGGYTWITLNTGAAIQATAFLDAETGWAGTWAGATGGGMYIFDGNLNVITGSIEGTVTDVDEGFPIEGATITLGTFQTTTDATGAYSMTLDVGIYTMTCELDGYEVFTQDNVEILEAQITTVNVSMQHLYLPPQNLNYSFTSPNVVLTWQDPLGTYALTGFGVYRDGVMINQWTSNIYIDPNLPSGTYTYYVTALYGSHESIPSNEVIVEVVSAGNNLVTYGSHLIGNYPNPFNPETQIVFALSEAADVKIEIFNIKGESICTIVNENLTSGRHSVLWTGSDNSGKPVSSGVYLYRLLTDNDQSATKKMILMK